MTELITYRGRTITSEDILFIRELIAAHPGESRRTLSTKLCEAWQWRQANGALRDMVCRGMLLMLHRAGHIQITAGEIRAAQPAGQTSAAGSGADRYNTDGEEFARPAAVGIRAGTAERR